MSKSSRWEGIDNYTRVMVAFAGAVGAGVTGMFGSVACVEATKAFNQASTGDVLATVASIGAAILCGLATFNTCVPLSHDAQVSNKAVPFYRSI